MTDKELCELLRSGRWLGETTGKAAADRIEALTAENERLREALGVAKMWSDKDWVGYEIVCKALAGATE